VKIKSISLILILLALPGTISVQQAMADEIMVLLRPAPFMYQTNPSTGIFPTTDTFVSDFGLIPTGALGSKGGCDSNSFKLSTPLTGNPTGPLGFLPPSNYQSAGFIHKEALFSQQVNPTPPSDLALVDTIVKRGQDIVLNNIGDSTTIDIELVSLSLRSVAPITVSYSTGCATAAPDSFFDVFVLSNGPQTPGTADFHRTGETSGQHQNWFLPINVLFRFVDTTTADEFNVGGNFILSDDKEPVVPFSIFPIQNVGGEYFTLDTTALLVSGVQTNLAWIIPVLSAAGIGAVVLRKKF